ncbi:adenine deaminase C-terminal domain-containing protein [Frankia nepalensis]|uniref:adenine deaminase n=1 Tax=Frankia nepalensis TaxID=1836974 RepID=A0A937RI48_9ACTN|nr:adenine deaminase C-terminal domain-containing protein [Frankia nepalensis]MBL7495503.1 adenine deaminase [Frankia nepalensis]MBL7510872.1 adenine deaminase [Frankia nepalensis]MBL7630607.1 adenine deaminase [Frankia nepalensis]
MSATTPYLGRALGALPGASPPDVAVGAGRAVAARQEAGAPAGGGYGLGPSAAELARLRRVAIGEEEADLLVHSGTVVVVQTGDLVRRDVAIVGRFIAAVTRPGALAGRRSLDASGRYLLPAYVDAHLRPERTLLLPGEAARLLVPRGTLTVLADTTALVTRCGPRGAALATTTATPLRVLPRRPGAAGPAPADLLPSERPGGQRTLADLVGYGQLACAVRRAVVAGMPPAEAIRRATLAPARRHGLDHVLGAITPAHLADLLIVTEIGGIEPPDLVVAGGRIAAGQGRPLFDDPDRAPRWALDTVRLPASLHVGSFALDRWPGHPAPLPAAVEVAARFTTPVVPSRSVGLSGLPSALLMAPGLPAAVPGVPAQPGAAPRSPARISDPDPGGPGEATPRLVRVEPTVRDGVVVADPARDLLKVAVIDRSPGPEPVRVGLVRGLGLTSGAIGVTATAPSGDLVLVGTNDADLLTAARALEGMGGGFVVVDRGWVQAACPLPVAGLVSDAPWEAVDGQLAAADAAAAAIGCRLTNPLQTMAELGGSLYTEP